MKKLSLLLTFVLGIMFSGCSSSNPAIAISLTPSGSQNAAAGQAVNVTATVANDSKAAGVSWSLTGPGALSGQTTTSVTYTAPSPISSNATATITATSVSDTTKTASVTINLQAVSIALSPSAAQTDEQGQKTNVTATVSNDPMNKGVTWSLTGAGSLSGQTATAVSYTAPATIAAASTVTLTATSVFDGTKTATLTINLVPPPSVTTSSLPAGTVGAAYSTTLAATNGVTPYSWSVTVGSLPAGLTLATNGAITGTPTAYGTSSFTVQVKDADNFTATANLSIKINPAPVNITTTSLPNGVVNASYSATLQSTGGATPITWSWAAQAGSTLPPGLVLAPSGSISGTPTAAGTFNVTVTATDSSTPALTATKNLSLTVNPQLVITTNSPLPNGITNTAYSTTLASTGGFGAIAWSVATGSTLPANLSLNPSTGAITGTPTTAGTFTFTVQAADSGTPQQKVTKAFTLTIIQQLVITTPPALSTGSVSTPYSVQLASSGGTGAVTWAVASGSTLPGGFSLTATGLLSGTPTTAGTFNFSITATDSGTPPQTATVGFTLTITPKLAITTTTLPSGTVNTNYSTTVLTNNGGIAPISWSWTAQAGSSLPPGLSIGSTTGTISGKPTAAGTFNVTVTAADSSTPTAQTASANFTISIATAPLSITTTSLPNAVVGKAYNTTVQSAGGNPPVTWSISAGSLPTWATLNPTTGAITGTPPNTTGSPFAFTVKATDSSTPTAQTATQSLSITVVAALAITTSSLPNGTVGSAYNTTVAATGGTTPYTWSWIAQTGSSLPPGLSINSSTGVISGTPSTNTGSPFNVTVTVTDTTNPQQTASANFSINVTVATLMVTTTSGSLPTGTANTAYPNTNLSATGGIPPYTWAQTGGTLPPGLTLSTSGTISGTPTTATGSPFSFTVTVTDSATSTANANLSITVNTAAADPCATAGTGGEALLSGHYVFVLKGFDNGSPQQPALVGGVLSFNGSGGITSGEIDTNLNAGFDTANAGNPLSVTSGTYKIGTSGSADQQRVCMDVNTAAGTQHYRASLNSNGSLGHMIGFDGSGPYVTGVLKKQSGSIPTTLSGGFAFGVSSAVNTANCDNSGTICGGRFGAVGQLVFSSGGTVTGGAVDFNHGNGSTAFLDGTTGTNFPASPVSITGGSYSINGTTGRGTLTFNPGGPSNVTNAVIYAVSSTDVLIMGSDASASNTAYAGEALQQTASSPSGTYVGATSRLGGTSGDSRADLIRATLSGGNITSLTIYQNDSGTTTVQSANNVGTYTFNSTTGRIVLTVTGSNHNAVQYGVNANQAFELDASPKVESGFFQSQTSTAAPSGAYAFGTTDPATSNVTEQDGLATLNSPNVNVTQDRNTLSNPQQAGQTQSQTFSVDGTGFGMVPSGCAPATSGSCQFVFYVISSTNAVGIDFGSSSPAVQPLDH